jgi:hypothetical protein
MNRQQLRSKLDHFGAAGGRLQPRAVVKGRIPIPDRRVISASRKFEKVRKFVLGNETLNLEGIFGILASGTYLGKYAESAGQ